MKQNKISTFDEYIDETDSNKVFNNLGNTILYIFLISILITFSLDIIYNGFPLFYFLNVLFLILLLVILKIFGVKLSKRIEITDKTRLLYLDEYTNYYEYKEKYIFDLQEKERDLEKRLQQAKERK